MSRDKAVTRYFEDFRPGEVLDCGSRTVTKEEIVQFARQWDPQPFHVDEAAAARMHFGGVIASGWHTCCIAMRLAVDTLYKDCANIGARGMDKFRFLRPLRPGDTVKLRVRVLEAVPAAKRPDQGLVRFGWEIHNQNEERVLEFTSQVLFRCRPKGKR